MKLPGYIPAIAFVITTAVHAVVGEELNARCDSISRDPGDHGALRRIIEDNGGRKGAAADDMLPLSAGAFVNMLKNEGFCATCDSREFVIRNVVVDGDLDISALEIKKPLLLDGVTIKGTLKMRNSHLVSLTLAHSTVGFIEADGLNVAHDMSVNEGSRIEGGLRMPHSKVGGVMSVNASEIQVGRDQERAVNLTGAELKGGLAIHYSNIRGNMVLIQGTFGKFEIIGSTVGDEKRSIEGDRFAISANWLSVTGPVLFDGTNLIWGNVGFLGAKVGGDFFLKNTSFCGRLDDVWVMDDATVGATLRISDVAIKGYDGHPDPTEGLRLKRTRINGDVDIQSTRISCAGSPGIAINADSLRCEGQVVIGAGNRLLGEVRLVGSAIKGNLEIASCRITNPSGPSVNAAGLKVEQSIQLRNLEADSPVLFQSASLGTKFRVTAGSIKDLKLDDASTTFFQIDDDSWPSGISLSGLRYERIKLPNHGTEKDSPRKQLQSRTESLLDSSKTLLNLASGSSKPYDPQPYEHLAMVMREMGNESVARGILTEMSKKRARYSDCTTGEKIWYRWIGWIIGYGYNPGRPFVISVVWMIIGWLIFARARAKGMLIDADLDHSKPETHSGTILFQSLAYSVESFTPIFKLGLCDMWKPKPIPVNDVPLWHQLFMYYSWIHTAAGWILASLWIGALTGIAK